MRDIVVLGGASQDITGITLDEAICHDSNPGSIYSSFGGAGRNIAENAARMGMTTALVSALGTDVVSRAITEHLASLNVDCSQTIYVEGAETSRYVSLLDNKGELMIAVADFDVIKKIDAARIRERAKYFLEHKIVFIDTNIDEKAIGALAGLGHPLVFADAVSVAKAGKLSNVLDKIHSLKANEAELEKLSGINVNDDSDLERAAMMLLEKGLERIFVTMGSRGACCASKDGIDFVSAVETKVLNVTGAGDSFSAAAALGTVLGMENIDILKMASAASLMTIESPYAVCDKMTRETLMTRYQAIK